MRGGAEIKNAGQYRLWTRHLLLPRHHHALRRPPHNLLSTIATLPKARKPAVEWYLAVTSNVCLPCKAHGKTMVESSSEGEGTVKKGGDRKPKTMRCRKYKSHPLSGTFSSSTGLECRLGCVVEDLCDGHTWDSVCARTHTNTHTHSLKHTT